MSHLSDTTLTVLHNSILTIPEIIRNFVENKNKEFQI